MTQEKMAFPTYRFEVDDFLGTVLLFAREVMRLAKRHGFDVFELPQASVKFEFVPTSREGQAALEDFLDEAAEVLFLSMKIEKLEPVESTE